MNKFLNFIIKFLFNCIDERTLCINIIKFLAWTKSFYISDINKRKTERDKWFYCFRTQLYGYQVIHNAKFLGKNFSCNSFSKVNENTSLGDNVSLNGINITGHGNVKIGNNFHCGIENLIITQTHDYDAGVAIPYSTNIYEDVVIEDFVWFGSRVTILPGTTIGEGAIIQAGSVVHGNIPKCAIAGGNPAKVFKYRDIENFEKLKKEKKFC